MCVLLNLLNSEYKKEILSKIFRQPNFVNKLLAGNSSGFQPGNLLKNTLFKYTFFNNLNNETNLQIWSHWLSISFELYNFVTNLNTFFQMNQTVIIWFYKLSWNSTLKLNLFKLILLFGYPATKISLFQFECQDALTATN